MSEYNVGDIVKVINIKKTFSRYSELFNHAVKKYDITGIKHSYQELPKLNDDYIVLAVVKHLTFHEEIVLIHNDNKFGYLIGIDGIELA